MLGIFLDQETMGLDSNRHGVLEVAFRIVDMATGEERAAYSAVVAHSKERWDSRDPQSITINGFSWEEVQRGKKSTEIAEEIISIFRKVGIQRGSSVFVCQNPSFDRPFFAQLIDPYRQEQLFWPYHWLDLASMFWALEVQECKRTHLPVLDELRLSKDTIAKALKLPTEARPHRAMQGVDHLLLCYKTAVGFPES